MPFRLLSAPTAGANESDDSKSTTTSTTTTTASATTSSSTSAADAARSNLDRLLELAVQHCPHAEVLWLMWAKERATRLDIDGARSVLQRAFAQNANSEHIWLAAVKLERDNNEVARARSLVMFLCIVCVVRERERREIR